MMDKIMKLSKQASLIKKPMRGIVPSTIIGFDKKAFDNNILLSVPNKQVGGLTFINHHITTGIMRDVDGVEINPYDYGLSEYLYYFEMCIA